MMMVSKREEQVLRCLADGMSTKEAGKALGISGETVQDYSTSIRRKLAARNAAHAVAIAASAGII